uniref:Trafficking protein particle complex subunit 6B n=1 Tax=Eptatretus burgeri TaxID=7764 RepID=A0A8C4WVL0_EPTBU
MEREGVRMADEALFEFLHMEVISYIFKSLEKDDSDNGKCTAKLEGMGFRVGQGLVERFTRDIPRFKDELDIMKFVCKDFWAGIFKKQVDNLRTNHQGVYVLQDNRFRLLTQISAGKQYMEHAPKQWGAPGTPPTAPTIEEPPFMELALDRFLAFTCGLVRGALSNLGVNSIVTAEVSLLPACKFQVMMQRA